MDFATLELIIDASQADEAKDKLDDLAKAGERAEKSTDKLSGSTREYSGAAGRAAEAAARKAATVTASSVAFAAVTTATLAAAAAATVLAAAWRQRQEAMEEAQAEIERLNRSLDALREKQRIEDLGPGGAWVEPLRQANEELNRMLTTNRGILDEFQEIGSTIVGMVAAADGFWDLFRQGFEASDTAQGLRDIRDLIFDIDRLTGGRLAKQIELNRALAIEEQQARVVAAQRQIIADKVAASIVVEDRLRRQREQEERERRRAAEEAARAAEQMVRDRERAFEAEIRELARGAELRLTTAEHMLRALDIEEEQLRIARDVNRALDDRITAMERVNTLAGVTGGVYTPSIVGGWDPSSNAGMILTPVTRYGTTTPRTFEGPTDAEIEQFARAMEATRELTSGIRDLAAAMDALSPALGDVLRGVDTIAQGAARIHESQGIGGVLGTLGQFSGALSIGAGIVQMVGGLLDNSAEREKREQLAAEAERAAKALRDFAEQVREVAELERLRTDASKLFDASFGVQPGVLSGTVSDMIAKGLSTEDIIASLNATEVGFRALSIGMDAATAAIDDYRLALEAIEEWRQREIAGVREDIGVRQLIAQGRDEEAAARRREIAQREELNRVMALGDEQLTADIKALHEQETAAAEAAVAAAKAQSIANFDVEISARRAALAGNDLAATQIRGEAAIAAQEAEWAKLVEQGYMTEEQLAALSDIMRIDLAESIDAAAEAARRATEDFLGMLAVEDLMAMGNTTDAAILRAEQRRDNWIDQLNKLDLSAEQYEQAMETINRITRNTIDSIIADAAARTGSTYPSIVDQEAERAVVRNARSITSMQAQAMVDILWSINAGVQETASNTRGSGGGFGVAMASSPTTVYDTGAETNINIYVTAPIDWSQPGAADRFADQIAEAVNRKLGGLNADATQATGTVLL